MFDQFWGGKRLRAFLLGADCLQDAARGGPRAAAISGEPSKKAHSRGAGLPPWGGREGGRLRSRIRIEQPDKAREMQERCAFLQLSASR